MPHANNPDLPDPHDLGPPSANEQRALLEQQAFASEHRRTEWLRNIWFWCVCILLVLATATISIAIVAVAWHYLAPSQWGVWLKQEQLRDVRTFLFSGAVTGTVGFVGTYVRNRI